MPISEGAVESYMYGHYENGPCTHTNVHIGNTTADSKVGTAHCSTHWNAPKTVPHAHHVHTN